MEKLSARDLETLSLREHFVKVLRAGVAQLPVLGPLLTEYMPDCTVEKLIQFVSEAEEELSRLKKNVNSEYLKREDVVVISSLVFRALAETSDADKKVALKNAFINNLLVEDMDAAIKEFYLRMLTGLTPLHFRVLKLVYFQGYSYENYRDSREVGRAQPIFTLLKAFPDMPHPALLVIVDELIAKNLLPKFETRGVVMNGPFIESNLKTEFGEQFMSFFKLQLLTEE